MTARHWNGTLSVDFANAANWFMWTCAVCRQEAAHRSRITVHVDAHTLDHLRLRSLLTQEGWMSYDSCVDMDCFVLTLTDVLCLECFVAIRNKTFLLTSPIQRYRALGQFTQEVDATIETEMMIEAKPMLP